MTTTPNNKPFRFNTGYEGEEKQTYLNITDDAIALYGEHCVYITQTLAQAEPIFGEYLGKVINEGTDVYLYVEQTESDFEVDTSSMYSKFGFVPNIGEATFHATEQYFDSFGITPRAQDLVYYPKNKQMFEINHVQERFGKYELVGELYNYDHTKVADDVTDIPILDLTDINDDDVVDYNDEIDTVTNDTSDPIIPADDTGDFLY